MTATHETNRAALALHDGQAYWDENQLAALQQLGLKDVTKADMRVFLHYCQKTGLDPFARQIYMIARRVKEGNEYVTRQTIQVGIDGYRVIADRAARKAGVVLSYGDTTWYDGDGQPHDVWVRPEPPAAARVVVYKDGKPFPGIARFTSFAAYGKDGKLTGLWPVMPDHQIAKCAEAQALRKAFPNDLGGIQTDDETAHLSSARPSRAAAITMPAHDIVPGDLDAIPPNRIAEPPEPDPGALKDNIGAQFHRLGIDDGDERDTYVRLLTGEDDLAALTIEQLARAVADLESCEDIGHLRYITGEDREAEAP
jgi:phage recombination protein Bet